MGRFALLICMLLVITLPASAQEDTSYGLLKGTVKLADGTPCAHISVVITTGPTKQNKQLNRPCRRTATAYFPARLPPAR